MADSKGRLVGMAQREKYMGYVNDAVVRQAGRVGRGEGRTS
ncbi:MAG TPA: hypothetical protein PLJ27_02365 [Polyangiaceae bacterium]|nr:MAG: hypothetical protein BWY17_04397 [Deltaproteobacteria bacterium ADurb.Bin207]HNS96624.1 hypothetical protein [Polyangiaceae bacterium]HNZ21038.1 hypothetical protein [Polyangiaceae bacterium]HOD22338.1 hypothetical protein [Polyangiaceae bacterium]HOE51216.1 hypothetical protein [Polyangiaceae bacterium]